MTNVFSVRLLDLCAFLKSLSDPTRLNAALLLLRCGELCVCDLVAVLGESQPKISRHLAQLRSGGIAETRRAGQWIYYRISEGLPEDHLQILEVAGNAHETVLAPLIEAVDGLRREANNCC